MPVKAFGVIGSFYGDEGKGLVTDYVVSEYSGSSIPFVVKHNGTAQAGHTVHHNGKRHVFSHFGSGTFLGSSTFFSEDFLVHPYLFLKEYFELVALGVSIPEIFAHGDCKVITPMDMFANRQRELQRGINRHGSCGFGLNEAMHRHEKYPITVRDLVTKDFEDVARMYRVLFECSKDVYGDDIELFELSITALEEHLDRDVKFFRNNVTVVDDYDILEKSKNVLIFESGQGLMLDKDYGTFPYVTHSNTGSKSILKVLTQFKGFEYHPVYVTRSYITRHGAGPLLNEDTRPSWVRDDTNIHNEWQQSLRYAPFSFVEFWKNIDYDFQSNELDSRYNSPSFIMTHMDQLPDVVTFQDQYGEMQHTSKNTFKEMCEEVFTLSSYGPERTDIKLNCD